MDHARLERKLLHAFETHAAVTFWIAIVGAASLTGLFVCLSR